MQSLKEIHAWAQLYAPIICNVFLWILSMGLQCVIVAFPEHSHLLFAGI